MQNRFNLRTVPSRWASARCALGEPNKHKPAALPIVASPPRRRCRGLCCARSLCTHTQSKRNSNPYNVQTHRAQSTGSRLPSSSSTLSTLTQNQIGSANQHMRLRNGVVVVGREWSRERAEGDVDGEVGVVGNGEHNGHFSFVITSHHICDSTCCTDHFA